MDGMIKIFFNLICVSLV